MIYIVDTDIDYCRRRVDQIKPRNACEVPNIIPSNNDFDDSFLSAAIQRPTTVPHCQPGKHNLPTTPVQGPRNVSDVDVPTVSRPDQLRRYSPDKFRK